MVDVSTGGFNMSWSDVDIELLVHACQARSPTTTSGFPVWLWSDFLQMPPHLEAVRRVLHLKAPPPRFEIVELNMTNVRRYVSDLPAAAEAIAAQSPAAMSDAVRAALLAQHGGLWVDTDILVAHELSVPFLSRTTSHLTPSTKAKRITTYSRRILLPQGDAGRCGCSPGK
jgi:hypothetical protein